MRLLCLWDPSGHLIRGLGLPSLFFYVTSLYLFFLPSTSPYFLRKSLTTRVWSGLKLLWLFAVVFVWPLCSTSMHCDAPSKFLMWRKSSAQSCFLLRGNFENLPKKLDFGGLFMALRVKISKFKQHQRTQCKKVILVKHILKFVILAL